MVIRLKISYNFEKDYFKKYNEANGAIFILKKLMKNPKLKAKTYLAYIIADCLWIFMAGLFINIVATFTIFPFLSTLGEYLMYLSVILFLILWLFFLACSKFEINNKKGAITISDEGITDEGSNGNKMFFPYQNVKMVIVTKNLIVFALNNPLMLFIPNEKKSEIKAILEKQNDIKIIDNN